MYQKSMNGLKDIMNLVIHIRKKLPQALQDELNSLISKTFPNNGFKRADSHLVILGAEAFRLTAPKDVVINEPIDNSISRVSPGCPRQQRP